MYSGSLPILIISFCSIFNNLYAENLSLDSVRLERSVENIVVLSKTYSTLRYFYPSKKLSKINWDNFLVKAVESVYHLSDDDKVIQTLNNLCGSENFILSKEKLENTNAASGKRFSYWRHRGFGQSNYSDRKGLMTLIYKTFLTPYKSTIVTSAVKKRSDIQPNRFSTYELKNGISLNVRHYIYSKEKEQNNYRNFRHEYSKKASENFEPNVLYERIATVIYVWSILNNFYPYHETVNDWDLLLVQYIKKAIINVKTEVEFRNLLAELLTHLHDGHAGVLVNGLHDFYIAKLGFALIDGNIVVTNSGEDKADIKAGDVLLEIDGKNAMDVFNERWSMVSASTNQFRTYNVFFNLLNGQKNSRITLKIRDADKNEKDVSLERTVSYYNPKKSLPPKTVIDSNIVYMDLSRCSEMAVIRTLSKIKKEKGIIFDLRPYPMIGTNFLGKLSAQKKIKSQNWIIPVLETPFQSTVRYDTTNWSVKKRKHTVPASCKVVFLTSHENVSYSETLIGFIKSYKLGTTIGGATAGTNGDMVILKFLNKYSFSFTGMKVTNQDNTTFQGVGIIPDIEVKRTMEGVIKKSDEVLDKAIDFIKEK